MKRRMVHVILVALMTSIAFTPVTVMAAEYSDSHQMIHNDDLSDSTETGESMESADVEVRSGFYQSENSVILADSADAVDTIDTNDTNDTNDTADSEDSASDIEEEPEILQGWVYDSEKNEHYYYKDNERLTNWIQIEGIWYYLSPESGARQTGWQYVGGSWYYMNASGQMQTGWLYENRKWYYLTSSGAMRIGWQYDNGKWYYLTSSGAMQTGWQYDNGKWYYLTSSGAMRIGWQYDNGKWYYLTTSGAMRIGWQYDNGKWYYLTSSGAMQTGWQYDSGKWYYLSSSGAMQTGWLQYGSVWYYLYDNGSMASDTVIEGYKIAGNGSVPTKTLVQNLVNSTTNNAMTNDQKIKSMWDWLMRNNWTYTRTYEHISSGWVWYSGWQDDFANQCITNHTGNCFRYAAMFGYMVKEATGYQVCVYHGMTPASRGGTTPHGWITVKIDNVWYAYDPDLNKFGRANAIYYKTPYSTTSRSIHLQGYWVSLY